jgi:hypothetical protein
MDQHTYVIWGISCAGACGLNVYSTIDCTDLLRALAAKCGRGIDVGQFGQRDLVAFLEGGETDMWILALDAFSLPADKANADASREIMMNRLRDIHAEGGETEHGVIIVTLAGVLLGDPNLFSMKVEDAFTFKDRRQLGG